MTERSVWRNPLFLTGFLYLSFLILASFLYTFIWDDEVRRLYFISENGVLVESAPISPKWSFPFGTDPLGLDMLAKILIGAKYTLIISFIIAFLRVAISLPVAFILGTYLQRFKKSINGTIDSFHYIPLSILAYFLLHPVLWEPFNGFPTTMTERLIIEIIVLTLLIVPILSSLLGNEVSMIYKEEFILSARVLGASKLRIIFKHIFPMLKDKLVVLFGQQIIQTLIVFIHLGLLQLFVGGTDVDYSVVKDPPQSMTNEWSGLIGDTFRYLQGAPWIPLTPILFFASAMFAVALMMEGYVRATSGHSYYYKKFKEKYKSEKDAGKMEMSVDDFKRVEVRNELNG
ncbi:ABC transporter permease subunit [Rossellomorea aquimaris]|uniref:ABC transporter permease n=1 Tax=Rossellomorea aquimaris TaxID=189382 RepID=UPI001CD323C0|nr:ABC transporter permease subunit [Rossellomorea aquimaris]MCA1055341.1 ABC transporter permease subunit [Rossellomorea aquimaris]